MVLKGTLMHYRYRVIHFNILGDQVTKALFQIFKRLQLPSEVQVQKHSAQSFVLQRKANDLTMLASISPLHSGISSLHYLQLMNLADIEMFHKSSHNLLSMPFSFW